MAQDTERPLSFWQINKHSIRTKLKFPSGGGFVGRYQAVRDYAEYPGLPIEPHHTEGLDRRRIDTPCIDNLSWPNHPLTVYARSNKDKDSDPVETKDQFYGETKCTINTGSIDWVSKDKKTVISYGEFLNRYRMMSEYDLSHRYGAISPVYSKGKIIHINLKSTGYLIGASILESKLEGIFDGKKVKSAIKRVITVYMNRNSSDQFYIDVFSSKVGYDDSKDNELGDLVLIGSHNFGMETGLGFYVSPCLFNGEGDNAVFMHNMSLSLGGSSNTTYLTEISVDAVLESSGNIQLTANVNPNKKTWFGPSSTGYPLAADYGEDGKLIIASILGEFTPGYTDGEYISDGSGEGSPYPDCKSGGSYTGTTYYDAMIYTVDAPGASCINGKILYEHSDSSFNTRVDTMVQNIYGSYCDIRHSISTITERQRRYDLIIYHLDLRYNTAFFHEYSVESTAAYSWEDTGSWPGPNMSYWPVFAEELPDTNISIDAANAENKTETNRFHYDIDGFTGVIYTPPDYLNSYPYRRPFDVGGSYLVLEDAANGNLAIDLLNKHVYSDTHSWTVSYHDKSVLHSQYIRPGYNPRLTQPPQGSFFNIIFDRKLDKMYDPIENSDVLKCSKKLDPVQKVKCEIVVSEEYDRQMAYLSII